MAGRTDQTPYSQVGAALPQALRLARCQASHLLQPSIDQVPSENGVIDEEVTREEERVLACNAGIAQALEDLFSWRHKDRTSRTSVLSYIESWRFQRTIYRIWLLSYLYGMGSVPTDRDSSQAGVRLSQYLSRQKRFLEDFDSTTLLQIRRVASFLRETATWVAGAEGDPSLDLSTYDFAGLYLFAGPRAILQCYEDVSTIPLCMGTYLDDGPYTGFLWIHS